MKNTAYIVCSFSIFLMMFADGGKIAVLQGDVLLGGLFKIYNPALTSQCSQDVDIMSVRNYEAVKWTLNILNQEEYIPGLKIGMESHATCAVPGFAAEFTSRLLNRALDDHLNLTSIPLIGFIGPEISGEAKESSEILSSMPMEKQLLQTLYSATASDLSDGSKYRNILRVIPSDKKQTKVIVNLMKELQWNYIAVIYENNAYGISGLKDLEKDAEKEDICIAKSYPVYISQSGAVDATNLNSLMENIISSHGESSITGVVIFATESTVKSLLLTSQNIKNTLEYRLTFIFSEAVSEIRIHTLNKYPVSKGAFFTSPPRFPFEEFNNYWENILTNKTIFKEEVKTDPWLIDVFGKIKACDPSSPHCEMPSTEQVKSATGGSVFDNYAILASLLHASALKVIHGQECKGESGICQNLNKRLHENKHLLIKTAQRLEVDTSKGFPIQLKNNVKIKFQGTANGELTGDIPKYELYHYRTCIKQGADFCLEKVATANNETIKLQTALLRDYYNSIDGVAWPNLNKAQCSSGKFCSSCVKRDAKDHVLFKKGDFYVVGVVPVYNKETSDPLGCDGIRDANGWELSEGLIFAVETINEKLGSYSDFFPNKKIGYAIINSCNQGLLTQSKLFQVMKNGITQNNTTIFQRNDILGFVSAFGSSISMASAEVLQNLNFVQVSYASTTPLLSDRNSYKYFLRVTTPDDKQAITMLKIVEKLNSSYIQIVYSEGSYGEGGRNALVAAAKDFKICIANEIKVRENEYSTILHDLQKKPYAKIVLLFLRSHTLPDIIQRLEQTMKKGEFLFIGSEAFGSRKSIVKNKPKFEGIIALSLEMNPISGFKEFVLKRLENIDNSNPWTKEYLQTKNACFLPKSFNKLSGILCEDTKKPYSDVSYTQEPWTAFAFTAMLSLLKGTNLAFASLCGKDAEKVCPDFHSQPSKVWEHVKNQELDIDNDGSLERIFDDNGDGNVGYKIYQMQKDIFNPAALTFKAVGRSTLDEDGFLFEQTVKTDPFKVLPSKCPNPNECKACEFSSITPEVKEPCATNSTITGVLGGLLALTLICLLVFIVTCVRRFKEIQDRQNSPYLDVQSASDMREIKNSQTQSGNVDLSTISAETNPGYNVHYGD